MNIKKLKEQLDAKAIKTYHGCSPLEIQELSRDSSLPLPEDYVDIMELIGRGAGKLFEDSVFFYPEIIGQTEKVRAIFGDDIQIPTSYYCCFNNLSSSMLFLDLAVSSPLRVYSWMDSAPNQFRKLSKNLSAILIGEIAAL